MDVGSVDGTTLGLPTGSQADSRALGGKMDIDSARFAILDRPACVWSPELDALNARFLAGVDPEFFVYEARVHQAALQQAQGERADTVRMHAAIALRVAYGVALESLFAYICALAQAPHCLFGWLSLYQPQELRALVERIQRGEAVRALDPFHPVSWMKVSSELLQPLKEHDQARYEHLTKQFADAWRLLASDFIDDVQTREYNSLKHGSRTQAGSLKFRFGTEDQQPLFESESPYGHAFMFLEKKQGRKVHYDVMFAAVAMDPARCSAALELIALTIHNVIALSRSLTDHRPASLSIKVPDTDQPFEALRANRPPIVSMTHGGKVEVPESDYWSGEQILTVYSRPEP